MTSRRPYCVAPSRERALFPPSPVDPKPTRTGPIWHKIENKSRTLAYPRRRRLGGLPEVPAFAGTTGMSESANSPVGDLEPAGARADIAEQGRFGPGHPHL